MPRLHFTCAYDGSHFLGWQSQRGKGTVQDCLEDAFAAILRGPLRIAAAGRTDAGVHALAQSFHADIPESCRMSPENWLAALNARLPQAVRILAVRRAELGFHARFSAVGKYYDYLICRAPVLSPFLAGRAWHLPRAGETERLAAALRLYEGEHDFRRLSARRGTEPAEPPPGYYHRRILSAEVCDEGDLLRLRFHGTGFMYRMVRLLVGTAQRVAAGKMSLEQLGAYMSDIPGETTRFCAPADGLYLRAVEYAPAETPEETTGGHAPGP